MDSSTQTREHEYDWNQVSVQKKKDDNGEVTRNNATLFCKGDAQEEGIDNGETFSPVARLEGVRILLAYSTYKGQSLSNGCEFNISEWYVRRRGLHRTT